MLWDVIKVFVLFIACTFLFYFGLRIMHSEYEQFHRYDTPEGPSVKVFNENENVKDKYNVFFRFGE